jgi:hypothetical protein
MYSKKLLKLANKLDNSSFYKLADKLDRIAQDMSVPYYRYPEQTRNTYKNRMPLKKDYEADSTVNIDNKFIKDAKIYLQQLVKDPLLERNNQAKIMFDTIINDPSYQMERSSFVSLINAYRRIYSEIIQNNKNVHKLSELKPEAERILLRMLSKM